MLQSHRQDGDGSDRAPGRTRQGGKGGSAAAARSPSRFREARRASRAPPGRTRCTRGGTDSGPAEPGSHNDGTRRSPPSAAGRAVSSPPPRCARGSEGRVEIGAEFVEGSGRSRGQGPDHERSARRERTQPGPHQVTQPAANLVADNRIAHRLGHDKAGARLGGLRRLIDEEMDHQGSATGSAATADRRGEVGATPQSLRSSQHDYLASGPARVGSGRQLAAALGTAGGEDGAAGPGAHAQPETVGLGAPAVVRLIGALAHVRTPSSYYVQGASAARRHFSRARRSNRSTLRRGAAVVNYPPGGTPTSGTVRHSRRSSRVRNEFSRARSPRGGTRQLMRTWPRC